MYIIYIMENLSSQIQKLTTEVSRLQKFVDTYEAQKATRIQLKNDYNNTYNIYLKKKKIMRMPKKIIKIICKIIEIILF